MIKVNNKKAKNFRKGNALVFVLIAFMIVSIFAFSILSIFNNNLKQAKHQQDSLEAYYLAYSGIELTFAYLMEYDEKEVTANNIEFGNGKINVVSKITDEEGFVGWVKITSVATLNKNGQKYTRIMYFDPINPVDQVWRN